MLARLARDILPLAWQLRGLMRRLQPDLVHLNDIIPVSRAGIIAAASLGIPIVCHVRALDPLTWLDRHLSRWVDGFIYISQAVAAQQRAAGATVRIAYVVPNGIDLAAFPLDLDGSGVRADLGIAPTTYLVGSVGRLVTWKGHHVVLRAFSEFAAHCPDTRLLIVGEPDVAEPGYDDYLRELALDLGVADQVTLTGHRADVPQVMAALDVLCHAAVDPEPFGRVVIEGMAACRPVIGSAAGGVLEIIEPDSSGLLYPPGNSQALALAMTALWQNPGLAASLAAAGRQRVEHCFTLAQYLHGVQTAYAAVIAQANRGGGDR
jgi:glycosyltransferase involved in cell wall biosynthesis